MKQLFTVALLIAVTIVVYDFFIAAPGERRVFPNDIKSLVEVIHRPNKPPIRASLSPPVSNPSKASPATGPGSLPTLSPVP